MATWIKMSFNFKVEKNHKNENDLSNRWYDSLSNVNPRYDSRPKKSRLTLLLHGSAFQLSIVILLTTCWSSLIHTMHQGLILYDFLRMNITNVCDRLECLSLASLSSLFYCYRKRLEPTRAKHLSDIRFFSKVAFWPYPQLLVLAGKACHWQTLKFITNISKLQT